MQTHEEVIDLACKDKWISSLAFFYQLKTLFKNGKIYNASLKRIASLMNCSINKVHYHLNNLEKRNLIKRLPDNKILLVKTLNAKYPFGIPENDTHRCTIRISKTDTLTQIIYKLYAKLLERKARHQLFAIKEKHEAVLLTSPGQPLLKNEKKRLRRLVKRRALDNAINPLLQLSDFALAKLLYISTKTASIVKFYLKKINYLHFSSKKEFIMKISPKAFSSSIELLQAQYGKVFFYNNALFKQPASSFTFNNYWSNTIYNTVN